MCRWLLVSIGILGWAVIVQGQIQFTAEVDRTRSGKSDPLSYTLTIAAASALDHVPGPELNLQDFDVQGPSIGTQSNSTYINGSFRTTFIRTLTYTLLPRRTGQLTIGSAGLTYGDKTYRTKAFKIQIFKGSAFSEKLFLRLEQEPDTVYVGQQVTLNYDLCYSLRLHNIGFAELPTFEGFWAKELFTAKQLQSHREMINGVAFNVASLRRVALFPTSAGVFRTGPLVISCDIPSARSRGGLLGFSGGLQSTSVRSQEALVQVLPLPVDGRPVGFSGAVGQFTLRVNAKPDQVSVGDPVTLKVEIQGVGNMDAVKAPALKLDDFTVYDPKTTSTETVKDRRYGGTHTYEYILIPKKSGTLELPPVGFSYFDPEGKAYKVLYSNPIDIVSQGEEIVEISGGLGMARQDILAMGQDIRYIKPDLEMLMGPVYWYRQMWFWVVPIFLSLTFVGLRGWQQHQQRLEGDVAYARRRRARSEADKCLNQADLYLGQGASVEFFAEIQRAVLQFLGDRFNVAATGLTGDSRRGMLGDAGIAEGQIDRLEALLSRCDFARFASGQITQKQMEELRSQAAIIIDHLAKGD